MLEEFQINKNHLMLTSIPFAATATTPSSSSTTTATTTKTISATARCYISRPENKLA